MGKCYAIRNFLDKMGLLSRCTLDEMNDLFDLVEYKKKFSNRDIMEILQFIVHMIQYDLQQSDRKFLADEVTKILCE